jgi:hypothetical protein
MRIRVGTFALGLLVACDGTAVDGLGDVCTLAGPDRVELNFGVVEPGRTVRRAIELRNTSASADCVVGPTRFEVLEGDGFFGTSVEPPVEPTQAVLPPQTALAVSFGFRPGGPGTSRARYVIETSDPRRPTLTVELVGSASEAGALLVTPNDLFFGDVAATCDADTKTVTVSNPSGAPATVARLTVGGADGAFAVVDAPALPAALQPGASLAFDIEFAPDAVGVAEGRLAIEVDVNGLPRTSTLALSGTGVVDDPTRQIDDFQMPSRTEVQLLLLVDARRSMADARQALSDAFDSLFELLEGADYRIAVMGTDADEGRFIPLEGPPAARVVTPESTPSPLEALRSNLARVQTRDHVNAPLGAAYAALTPPNLTGPNAGFLGPRAWTSLIALTDRADASAETPDFYVNFITSLRGGLGPAAVFSAVAAGVDGCPADGTIPETPPRLTTVANRTGGRAISICRPDWTQGVFQGVRLRPTRLRPRLFLTNQPIEGTIEVFVDDVPVDATGPDGQPRWRYAFTTNEIQFGDAHAPPPGAQVRVTYAAACL